MEEFVDDDLQTMSRGDLFGEVRKDAEKEWVSLVAAVEQSVTTVRAWDGAVERRLIMASSPRARTSKVVPTVKTTRAPRTRRAK